MRRDRIPLGSQARGSQASAASIPTCVSRGIVVVGNKASRRWVRAMCEAHMAVPRASAGKGFSRASMVGRGIPAASTQRLPVP